MPKKEPQNIQWIVSGRAIYSGATCIVHAKDRAEAIARAQAGNHIGGVELEGAELAGWDFRNAEPDVED